MKANKKAVKKPEKPQNDDFIEPPTLSNISLNKSLSILIGIIAFLLYANTLGHQYALDDKAVITENKLVQKGFSGIGDLLTTFYWQGYWNTNAGLYRPLSMVTYAIEWQFFGENPAVSHWINALLYVLIGVLLFDFLRKLLSGFSLWIPFIATVLFIVHPVHTEVVANIKSRDELLCFLFFILAARSFIYYVASQKKSVLLLAVGSYFLCLLSKEGGILFLPIFPLILYFFRSQKLKSSILTAWPLMAISAIYLAIHSYVIYGSSSPRASYSYADNALLAAPDFITRLGTSFAMMTHYFRLLIFPNELVYDYSFNQFPITGFENPFAIIGFGLIIGLVVIALKGFNQRSFLSFGILYFGISFSLTSNLFVIIGATMAERFLFAPSLGFCLIAAFLAFQYFVKKEKPATGITDFFKQSALLSIVLFGLVLLAGAKTITRNNAWENDAILFANDVKLSPNSARTHFNYGVTLMDAGINAANTETKKRLLSEPIREFEAAIAIDSKLRDALHNLAICCYFSGDYEKAIRYAKQCLQLDPNDASTYAYLGYSYYRSNKYDLAIEAIKDGIEKGYEDEKTYSFLGGCHFAKRDFDMAIANYQKALSKNPNDAEQINNLASAYGSKGEANEALALFKKSFDLNPKSAQTAFFIGITYQNLGDEVNANLWLQKSESLKTQ